MGRVTGGEWRVMGVSAGVRGAKGDYGVATLRVPETRAQHCGLAALGCGGLKPAEVVDDA
jgi:hypothetical protein